MNTSILTVILTGSMLAAQTSTPSWLNDYAQAQRLGEEQKKPLVVVFGLGPNGWNQLIRDTTPTAEVQQLLTDNYVCVYVNTSSVAGNKLARDFDIADGVGLVISDRTGRNQAFWHQGVMTNQNLVQYLSKHAASRVMADSTETVNTPRTSFYSPQSSPSFNSAPSTFFQGGISPFSAGSSSGFSSGRSC